eukprot:TRINITY_DN103482_c0_g1_i1.p1 TRINITY_DN103482_c0_g1~~TRINITY_DN103482_c0_g1_i1.p1  ORF type:complete len:172 (-),score=1.89 TRINITY_DN103482_c0_g1_i1:167-682(-)
MAESKPPQPYPKPFLDALAQEVKTFGADCQSLSQKAHASNRSAESAARWLTGVCAFTTVGAATGLVSAHPVFDELRKKRPMFYARVGAGAGFLLSFGLIFKAWSWTQFGPNALYKNHSNAAVTYQDLATKSQMLATQIEFNQASTASNDAVQQFDDLLEKKKKLEESYTRI